MKRQAMAHQLSEGEINGCERLLAEALRDVATELRLVDVGDFIAYVRNSRLANIRDLIASSSELYFQPGTLQFGDVADADTPWDAPANILLDLEFQHDGLTAFVRLTLSRESAAVEMLGLHGTGHDAGEVAGMHRLALALEGASIKKAARQ